MSDYIPSFYRYVSSITIDNGGAGYQNVPTITISGGNGTGATATAEVFNGAISKINITNMIGASQSFFRIRRKIHNSFTNSILLPYLELIFEGSEFCL